MTQTISETTTMSLDERSQGVLQDCQRQVQALAEAWRGDPSIARVANETLLRSLIGILGMGGQVVRDDDLSLVLLGPITVGMVFHPTHRRVQPALRHDLNQYRAPFTGRYCMRMVDDNTRYCASPLFEASGPEWRNGRPSCSCNDPGAVLAMPIPGTWSLHS